MATKRKCSSMAVEKKKEILHTLESGRTEKFVIEKYSIAPSCVRYISEQKGDIKKFFEIKEVAVRSPTYNLRNAQRTELDRVLYKWCTLCWGKNIETSATVIRNKALELNEKLKENPHFEASKEWVREFMRRHRINEADIKIFRNSNIAAADIFKLNFESYLKSLMCRLENVYNVAYTGLMWRIVPRNTCIFRNEKSMVCPKMSEDHVTVLLCANATGCHKLPALVIAKCRDSQNFNNMNINSSSIMYEENSTAFISNKVFHKWFIKCFLKSITKRQKRRKEKTFLMVDTTRWYSDFDKLKVKDKYVIMKCFPYYAAPHLQPMDCGIIECFKLMYKKELLETLLPLPNCNTEDNVIRNQNDLILWDCCRMIRDAWLRVENTILKVSWSKLLLNENIGRFACTSIIERNVKQIHALLAKLPGCDLLERSDLENWFKIDEKEQILMKLCTEEVYRDLK